MLFLIFLPYLAGMTIKEWCPEERPREKMRLRGAKALSNAELLAILLGSGTGGKNVVEVAQELMVSAGGRLTLLSAMPLERLLQVKRRLCTALGSDKTAAIRAAVSMGVITEFVTDHYTALALLK